MPIVIVTKKLTKKQRNRFPDGDFQLMEHNFIRTKKIAFSVEKNHKIVVFTSKNGVKSVWKQQPKILENKTIICVGTKTKTFIEKIGFQVDETADYAEDLIEIMNQKYQGKTFTFFCGNIRRNTIPNYFKENQIAFEEVIVYETETHSKTISEKFDGILFFSPSAIASFLEKNELKNETCFCIGTTTAKALESRTKNILIASKPTVEHVIDEVINYYKRL
jgi:uroporphyrinogen-III synthase